ncbi:development-specific protein LVN1.2-like [Strongylocentrotus purpuratus]|uniref:Ependymin-related protein n=1 Tax=Strongylocentrotus purpuratus TaxID=7668 RepID=A0A7M7P0R4_STRPU|nr:development-specific protein LVN1.2-like [Strongylocentrotus purpuratus]
MKLIAFSALFLLTVASAQKPCCGPMQIMTGNGATVGIQNSGPQGYYTYAYGAFDYTNRRFGYNINVDRIDGKSSHDYRVVQKYDQDTEWIIHEVTQSCLKRKAYQPEPSACVPNQAVLSTTFFLGGNQGLLVDSWSYTYSSPKDPLDGVVALNQVHGSCLPTGGSIFGKVNNGGTDVTFVIASGVLNMTVGIPDPDRWFTLPSYCNQTNALFDDSSVFDHEVLKLPVFF